MPKRDIIGEAFGIESAKPVVVPVAQPAAPSNRLAIVQTLILLGFLVVLGMVAFNRFGGGGGHRDDQHHEQRDDDKKQDDKQGKQTLNLKEHVLVVIRDKKTLNDDVEYTITMQDDEFWGWAKTVLADVEVLEDDDELAVKLLGAIADKPPLVALLNIKTKKPAWSMPLPKGGTDPIRSKLQ